jgi:hypothetical protein
MSCHIRRRHRAASLVLLGFACAAVGLTGCGGEGQADAVHGVAVKGRLLNHGKPLKLKPNEQVQVTFVSGQGGDKNQVASIGDYDPETGLFEIAGPSGQGIPPGTYRVGIASSIYGGEEDTNRFEEQFNAEVTPLEAQVGPEEGQEFDVDLGTKRVTKK